MEKYVSIHGHFYQPPRENPWLMEVESQDSAYPYHDWNKKITDECYAANATSQILDSDRKIIDIVNAYASISFDFGPTLLSWLERNEKDVYRAILEADRKSREKYPDGLGSAMAQPYNHMIMPLANPRDKQTQIIWGVKDFEHRFKRKPEGMWLPETAVDSETLDIMAGHGIKFTVLGPHQAARAREIGETKWVNISKSKLDVNMPYLCQLPSGRSIAIFFYDGPISHDVAFGDLLNDGVNFAKRLISASGEEGDAAGMVNIATDGETFGHHHRFGDMALSYCIYHIETNNLAEMTNYSAYLAKYPPTHEVEILENSSWSCAHGVERWQSDCGCNSGANPGWKQDWREPLREGMDWLAETLARIYEKEMSQFTKDPWAVRNEYIEVVLDRSREKIDSFVSGHASKKLTKDEKTKFLKLLEIERNAMFMYTSCEWFFDDISGIEGIQGLEYAARAIQLAKEVSGASLEKGYLEFLKDAPSNIPEFGNGAKLYDLIVKPAVIDSFKVAVHYAISSLFEDYGDTADMNAYTVKRGAHSISETGEEKLVLGTVTVISEITLEETSVSYAALHLGDCRVFCGAKERMGEKPFAAAEREIRESFTKGEIKRALSLVDRHFGGHPYSLEHVFKDKRVEILSKIFYGASKTVETLLRNIYRYQYPAAQTVKLFEIPTLKYFYDNLVFTINMGIFKLLKGNEKIDYRRLKAFLGEAEDLDIQLDDVTMGFLASKRINSIIREWAKKPGDASLMEEALRLAAALEEIPLDLHLRESQNACFYIGKSELPAMLKKASSGDKAAKIWVELFGNLEDSLKIEI